MSPPPPPSRSAVPTTATTDAQTQALLSPCQQTSIYNLMPYELRAEIAAVISREDQTHDVLESKRAIADAIYDSQNEDQKRAEWEVDQPHTAYHLQGNRKVDLMNLLDKAERKNKKAKKASTVEKVKMHSKAASSSLDMKPRRR